MLKLAEYRQHAADCRRLASKATDADQRKMLLDMAEAWDGLAAEREKFLQVRPAEPV